MEKKNHLIGTRNIQPDLNKILPWQEINSGIMTVHNNDPKISLMIQKIFSNIAADS